MTKLIVLLALVFFLTLGYVTPTGVESTGDVSLRYDDGQILLKYIEYQSKENRIPVRLVHNVIKMESNWRYRKGNEVVGDSLVCSTHNAYGLMQVLLGTGKDMEGDNTITPYRLMSDNLLNVRCGTRYIAYLIRYYRGNVLLAMCAYHRGMRYVNFDLDVKKVSPINDYVRSVMTGVPYSPQVLNKWNAEIQSRIADTTATRK